MLVIIIYTPSLTNSLTLFLYHCTLSSVRCLLTYVLVLCPLSLSVAD